MIFLVLIIVYFIFIVILAIKFASQPSFVAKNNSNVTISILVAFKNEEQDISKLIAGLKDQNYKKELLQIILINDNSTDNSYEIAQQKIKNNNNFTLLNLTDISGKKQALLKGLKIATNQLILHTDADVELNPNWVLTIASFYTEYKFKLAIAPVLYKNEKDAFALLQSLEIVNIAGVTAGSALYNKPLMNNGANLAYCSSVKNLFAESINNKASGDDMFFLQKIITEYPKDIKYIKSLNAVVYSFAEKSFKGFLNQRLRWVGKSSCFTNNFIVGVGIYIGFINFIIFANLILVLIFNEYLFSYLIFLSIKFTAEFITSIIYTSYFKKYKLLIFMPLLFVVYPMYIAIIGLLSLIVKAKWKGNSV